MVLSFENYEEMYRQKLRTADEAVKVIKSGDWVDYGFCAIHPRVLDEALARRAPELEDVKVRGGISLWKPAIFDIEDPADHIIFNSHHMSSVERCFLLVESLLLLFHFLHFRPVPLVFCSECGSCLRQLKDELHSCVR